MSLKIDRLQLEIIINNDQARKSLRALDDEARQINKELKGLTEGTQEWVNKSERLKVIKTQMDSIYDKIGLTGLSMKELTARQKELNMILRQMDPRLPQYKALQNQLTAVSGRIGELRGKAAQAQLSFKGLADSFNRYFAIVTAGIAAFTGMVFSIKQLITAQGELSDSLANIRKSTGMTAAEVEDLNKKFGKIDTRTSRQDLRQMAVVAGQLGIAKNDIFAFVDSVDKLNVALGDEFTGGAEEVAKQMGMLRNVLTDMKTASVSDDMMRVGNAINVLGAAGFATGPVVTDFASRIGGLGIPLGLTSDEVLGLSATLQELNVNAERGGTAVVKILQKMTTNTEAFAKIAGMPLKEFTNLVNTDLYGAFLKVVEGSKKGGQSATALAGMIKEMEISGVGASEIFAKLSTNTGMLAEKVKLAGDSLQGTASITQEFNIKNATLGATLAKLSKDFYKLITLPGVTEFFKYQVYHIVQLVNWFKDLPLIIEKYRIALIAITGITLTWIAAKTKSLQVALLNNLTLKDGIGLKIKDQVVMSFLIAKEELLTIWKGKGTVATKLAATAQLTLNAAMNAAGGIIGIVILAITAAAVAISAYKKYSKEALDLERERGREVALLENSVKKLSSAHYKLSEEISKLNTLSQQEKLDLKEKIDNTLKLAKAELQLAKAKQLHIEKSNQELSMWQNVVVSSIPDKDPKRKQDVIDYYKWKNGKEAASEMNDKINELDQSIIKLEGDSKALNDIVNAEKIGDSVSAKTFDALEEKLHKYQTALRNTTAGSVEYNRIQNKIKETNKELAKFQAAPEADGLKEKKKNISLLEDLNKKIKEYIELLQVQVIKHPELARSISDKILLLEKEKEKVEELIKSYQNAANLRDAGPSTPMQARMPNQKTLDSAFKKNSDKLPDKAPGTVQMDHTPLTEYDTDTQIWAKKASAFLNYADAVMNGLMSIDQMMSQMENAQIARDAQANDEKKSKYKRQLDSKVITQKQYDQKVAKLDDELDAKKRKLAHDQAVRQKSLSLVQAIINTAQGITGSLAQGGIMGIIMAALVGILGAVQIAYIASTPVPAAAKGRYKAMQAATGKYDVIGESDNKLYKGVPFMNSFTGIPGKPLLVNETGNEIVIDPYTTRNLIMNYPQVIEGINQARVPQRATGQYYEGNESVSGKTKVVYMMDPEYTAAVKENNELMKKGIVANVIYDDLRLANEKVDAIETDVSR